MLLLFSLGSGALLLWAHPPTLPQVICLKSGVASSSSQAKQVNSARSSIPMHIWGSGGVFLVFFFGTASAVVVCLLAARCLIKQLRTVVSTTELIKGRPRLPEKACLVCTIWSELIISKHTLKPSERYHFFVIFFFVCIAILSIICQQRLSYLATLQ